MTKDLEAINALSDQWDSAYQTEGLTSDGRHLRKDYCERGDRILAMYEAEAVRSPGDADVTLYFGQHLFRLATTWYSRTRLKMLGAYNAEVYHGAKRLRERDGLELGILNWEARSAENACGYAVRSYGVGPDAGAAFTLAKIFREVGFYATALDWAVKMEDAAETKGLPKRATEARAIRLELTAAGLTADPMIGHGAVFPTRMTPGLLLAGQPQTLPGPPSPPPMPPALRSDGGRDGRCFVATACYGSYDHPSVGVFRRFRDERLLKTPIGAAGVRCYYVVSPPVARVLSRVPGLADAVRKRVLEPLARHLA